MRGCGPGCRRAGASATRPARAATTRPTTSPSSGRRGGAGRCWSPPITSARRPRMRCAARCWPRWGSWWRWRYSPAGWRRRSATTPSKSKSRCQLMWRSSAASAAASRSGLQGGDQRLVVGLGRGGGAALLRQAPDHRELPRQALPQRQQRRIAGGAAQLGVEILVRQHDGGGVAEAAGLGIGGGGQAEAGEAFRPAGAAQRLPHRQAFQRQAHAHQRGHAGIAHLHQPHALVGRADDDALAFQQPQRLPHRAPG